jgi:hypothetical protein
VAVVLVLLPRLALALLVAIPHRLALSALFRRVHAHRATPPTRLVGGDHGSGGGTFGEGSGLARSTSVGGQGGQAFQDLGRFRMGAAELGLENGQGPLVQGLGLRQVSH